MWRFGSVHRLRILSSVFYSTAWKRGPATSQQVRPRLLPRGRRRASTGTWDMVGPWGGVTSRSSPDSSSQCYAGCSPAARRTRSSIAVFGGVPSDSHSVRRTPAAVNGPYGSIISWSRTVMPWLGPPGLPENPWRVFSRSFSGPSRRFRLGRTWSQSGTFSIRRRSS
jgi:hypothetical protein